MSINDKQDYLNKAAKREQWSLEENRDSYPFSLRLRHSLLAAQPPKLYFACPQCRQLRRLHSIMKQHFYKSFGKWYVLLYILNNPFWTNQNSFKCLSLVRCVQSLLLLFKSKSLDFDCTFQCYTVVLKRTSQCCGSWSWLINIHNKIWTRQNVQIIEKSG